ncbi:MAG: SufD family Fe-S cluster assembly protein [Paludibacteraceae bacterium]|nr:SufD family Fe-S cluster assembly protein [Paludibacteraceae bacterium]
MSVQQLHISQGEHRQLVIMHVAEDCAQWQIKQEADSVLTVHVFCLEPDAYLAEDVLLDIEQAGEHAETYIYGLGILTGRQQVNVRTHVKHSVPNGRSNQLLKFAVRDEAQGTFVGELIVAPHAQHTEAMQTNRNVLLSPAATMHTQPQLEIYADDVKCSHGATTGQIDESALFYMQQRGIAPDEARRLLLAAFFHDVLTTLNEPAVEERIQRKIEKIIL